jgi:hypothetical protein
LQFFASKLAGTSPAKVDPADRIRAAKMLRVVLFMTIRFPIVKCGYYNEPGGAMQCRPLACF